MTEKKDWLAECNNHKVPVEDFELAFCKRCMAPDCSRSNSGKSRFEQRVSNWYERLFDQPARMSDDDPRLVQIKAKRFVDLPAGPVPEIGRAPVNAWIDPRDLDEPVPAPLPPPPVAPTQAVVAPSPEAPPVAPLPPVVSSPSAPQEGLQLLNTPRPAAQMLGGKSPPAPAAPVPVVDKWATKPVETDATKVKPGARIRFGGT